MSDAVKRADRGVHVWDWPVRLFHWGLVAALAVAWYSAEQGLDGFTLHKWAGYTILVLLVFRLLWGLVGSETARFSDFVRGPATTLNYLRGWLRGDKGPTLGHNPLGGLAILAMFGLIAFQAVSGLFADDDILVSGPFSSLVDGSTRRALTGWHKANFDWVLLVIGLHLLALLLYRLVRRERLVKAMITGYKEGVEGPAPWMAPLWRAVLLLAVSVALVAGAIAFFG